MHAPMQTHMHTHTHTHKYTEQMNSIVLSLFCEEEDTCMACEEDRCMS
jgi:hypothetical protein